MAGHSKWAQIKRKKAVNDNKRGAMYAKHLRSIASAVRQGNSGDPAANLGLKNALTLAKRDGVPADNIARAIEKSLGGGDGISMDEVIYEGYGPAGVAVMVYALTENRNRTAGEVRHAFTKYGGNMSGGVAWMFERKGLVTLPKNDESTQELAIELGADDFESYEEDEQPRLDVYTAFTDLNTVAEGFRSKNLEPIAIEFVSVAANTTEVSNDDAAKVVRFLEALEDLEDVQNVYSNANLESMSS